ncbi:flagellin protein FlaA [Caloranaerobacter sp. TR13]|uniref:flagellin N-terminal helical domain-containing protein n=1 Tax=Caloranaerobacter sp. TR13 TaxID=1302151 RepID=UPI0006D4127D|nr:flagellin [Caloranaerobacter sp. TR13]KPU26427.1 flagellin protein FlaA [Caloranaerobacter sp. TR13]
MRINHNIAALNTYSRLSAANFMQSKSLEKLSSGMRINRAGDDAAGLAISEKMRGQIRGLEQASRNAQDGISLIQTAEGALNETQAILQRMRELAVQAASDTNTSDDRAAIQKEIDQLVDEIDRIANTTEFNTKKLLTGEIGLSTDDSQNITNLSMKSTTKAGTITFTADATLAKKATGQLTVAAGATQVATSDELIITVNGKTYNIGTTAGQSYEDLAKQITNTVDGLVATWDASANQIKFETELANADQTFTVAEKTAGSLDGATDFTAGTATNDIDTSVSRNGSDGTNASGLATAGEATFSYYGNTVTVTGGTGGFEGLTFTLQADEGSTTTATVSGSKIYISNQLTMQIGANEGQEMSININAMDSTNLNVSNLDVSTTTGASSAITKIDSALQTVSSERAKLGAYQNRLEHTINNLGTASENLTASESRIRDVDMAKEMMEFTKNNILQQAATAMLAQANQMPSGVLQLLR